MNDIEASSILKSMIQFIQNHGNERVATINKQSEDEFTVQKENYIAEEKERIAADVKERLRKDEITLKIERSKNDNKLRIERMKTTNELIIKLYKESRVKIVQKQKESPEVYKELVKNLIIQGLIKLMEPEVNIRCKKSDEKVVQSVLESASAEYKRLL